jgi:hypothetical protein
MQRLAALTDPDSIRTYLTGVSLPAEFAFTASSLRPPPAHPTSSSRTLPA